MTATVRKSVAALVVIAFLAQACATGGPLVGQGADPGRAALVCGAGGALVGAAAGAAIGSRGRKAGATHALVGALIGAVVGGVAAATACFAVSYKSEAVKDYRQTQQAVGYQPSQGTVVHVSEFTLTPAVAAPGNTVTFQASYYIMAPEPDQGVIVTEMRIITAVNPTTGERKELGRDSTQVTVKPGGRRGDGQFEIRPGVAVGRYEVAFVVESGGQRDEKLLTLDVTKDVAALSDPKRQVARVTSEPAGTKSESVGTDGAAPRSDGRQELAPQAPPSGSEISLSSLGEPNPAPPPIVQVAEAGPQKTLKDRYFVASRVIGTGNVREGPAVTYKVVAEISKGERYPILDTVTPKGSKSAWHKIRLENGREAWVNSTLGDIQE